MTVRHYATVKLAVSPSRHPGAVVHLTECPGCLTVVIEDRLAEHQRRVGCARPDDQAQGEGGG